MSQTNLAAPLNRGVVRDAFAVVQGRQLLSYRAGEVVHVDAFTRATIDAAGGDVHWGDQDVVPGLPFNAPGGVIPVSAMRVGVIYAADTLDPEEAKAAHKAGRLARVSVVTMTKTATGWILAA